MSKQYLACIIFCIPAFLFAQVEFTRSSSRVAPLDQEALRSGKILPFNTYPASLFDLQAAYRQLFPDGAQGEIGTTTWVHPGIYGRFGFDLNIDATITAETNRFWNSYGQYLADTRPFAQIRLSLQDENSWGIYVQLKGAQQYGGLDNTNYTNLPVPTNGPRTVPVEYHFIEQGYLWYNLLPLRVTFGRAKLHYGPLRNSLVLSDKIPFLDMLRLHLPMGQWNFDYAVASPETRVKGGGSSVERTVFLVTHRIDWGLPEIRFGFNEHALLDRNEVDAAGNVLRKGDYLLTDFLPIISYHQAEISPFNTSISFDVEWAVAPDWRISAQYGLDEVNANDVGIPDSPTPTIWAFIVGNELQGKIDLIAWNWYSEIGYTHYLWGNFDDDKPFAKGIYYMLLDNGTQEIPLTSPYGPGTAWINTQLSFEGDVWSAGLSVEIWNIKDGVSLRMPYQETGGTGGFGSVWNYKIFLKGTVQTGPVEWYLEPGVIGQNAEIKPQLRLGAQLSFNVSEYDK